MSNEQQEFDKAFDGMLVGGKEPVDTAKITETKVKAKAKEVPEEPDIKEPEAVDAPDTQDEVEETQETSQDESQDEGEVAEPKTETVDLAKKELDDLRQKQVLYDQFLADPFAFIHKLQSEAMKGIQQEPPLETRIKAIYDKYGFNAENPLDPAEAWNNPNSDHAKCIRDVQNEQSKEQFKQFQIQQNMAQVAKQQEEYIRQGDKLVMETFSQLEKEYGATKEDYSKIMAEINEAQNTGDLYKLIANYMKYKVMATKGTQKKLKTSSVEKQLETAKQKEIPSVPAGGKVASTAKKESNITDDILKYSGY